MKKYILGIMLIMLLTFTACTCLTDDIPTETLENGTIEKDLSTESVWIPISAQGKHKEYVTNVTQIPCEEENMIYEDGFMYNPIHTPDEYGYYGYKGTTLINGSSKIVQYKEWFECKLIEEYDENGFPKSGTFLYRLEYDPNNGFIYKHLCNYENKLVKHSCPKNESGDYIQIDVNIKTNPNYNTYLALI